MLEKHSKLIYRHYISYRYIVHCFSDLRRRFLHRTWRVKRAMSKTADKDTGDICIRITACSWDKDTSASQQPFMETFVKSISACCRYPRVARFADGEVTVRRRLDDVNQCFVIRHRSRLCPPIGNGDSLTRISDFSLWYDNTPRNLVPYIWARLRFWPSFRLSKRKQRNRAGSRLVPRERPAIKISGMCRGKKGRTSGEMNGNKIETVFPAAEIAAALRIARCRDGSIWRTSREGIVERWAIDNAQVTNDRHKGVDIFNVNDK